MHITPNNYITQNKALSGSNKIAGVRLPDFNDVSFFSKNKTGTNDSQYEQSIIAQAIKDQAKGKFQNESLGFNQLMKRYVSEVSPDRKGIILESLQKIADNDIPITKPLDFIALLFDGEVKYQEDCNTVNYAEFYDKNGEMIEKYSNGEWTMFTTKAENTRQVEMCSIYNEAWRMAAKTAQSNNTTSSGFAVNSENLENKFDTFA